MILRSATVTAGMSLSTILKMVRTNGLGMHPLHLMRFLIVLSMGSLVTVVGIVALPIRWLLSRVKAVRTDPVFIVGHWRTGSTYLHELLALDGRFSVPTTLLCSAPWAYPLGLLFIKPFMYLTSYGKRPMDNVHVGPGSPQEDEFALFRLTGDSPVKGLVYPPGDGRYFLSSASLGVPAEAKARQRWIAAMTDVIRAVAGIRGRRPLIKNPFHSFRIAALRKLFPDATFIYIQRDPAVVIPSTMRMWSIIGRHNTLRGRWRGPSMAEVIDVYNRLEADAQTALSFLSPNRRVAVTFEALEKDPVAVLREIYGVVQLTVTPRLEEKWRRMIRRRRGYRKNRYPLNAEALSMIRNRTKSVE